MKTLLTILALLAIPFVIGFVMWEENKQSKK